MLGSIENNGMKMQNEEHRLGQHAAAIPSPETLRLSGSDKKLPKSSNMNDKLIID